jgi:3-hydroxyisobutyrate dehydrogenase-like beta-hydroxyacid dehydrogenase
MTKIGFLGLGRMGAPMAGNLVKAGHDLTVWNRTVSKAEEFADQHGATAAATPREAVRAADFVVTMLADDAALLQAYDGPDGALAGLRAGAVAIDMSTVSPQTVLALAEKVTAVGGRLVDAPVSGSVAAATAGALTIMAAGDTEAVDQARPVLGDMGDPVIHMGGSSRGATMKLCVNAIVHSLNGAVSESLVLAERAGIDRLQAYSVFLNSAVAAPFVQYRQEAFEKPGRVPVAFRLELAAKDLRLALEAADRAGASLPQTQRNLQVLEEAVAAGFGDLDESGVAEFLRVLSRSANPDHASEA